MQITMINPAVVLGPPIGNHVGASPKIIQRLISNRDLILPRIGYPIVDVRDVAGAHLSALSHPASIGQRYVMSSKFYWHAEVGRVLAQAFPERNIKTRVAPDWIFRGLGKVSKAVNSLVPMLGHKSRLNGTKAERDLEFTYRNTDTAIIDTAKRLIDIKKA
jgi:dihydroflavonol-4-reductase